MIWLLFVSPVFFFKTARHLLLGSLTAWSSNFKTYIDSLPSLLLICLAFACLKGSKPNSRDDVQCVQSTQGASYTCTALLIISETVQTRKPTGNKSTQGLLECTLWDDMLSQPEHNALLSPVLVWRLTFLLLYITGWAQLLLEGRWGYSYQAIIKKQGVLSTKWEAVVESQTTGHRFLL